MNFIVKSFLLMLFVSSFVFSNELIGMVNGGHSTAIVPYGVTHGDVGITPLPSPPARIRRRSNVISFDRNSLRSVLDVVLKRFDDEFVKNINKLYGYYFRDARELKGVYTLLFNTFNERSFLCERSSFYIDHNKLIRKFRDFFCLGITYKICESNGYSRKDEFDIVFQRVSLLFERFVLGLQAPNKF